MNHYNGASVHDTVVFTNSLLVENEYNGLPACGLHGMAISYIAYGNTPSTHYLKH